MKIGPLISAVLQDEGRGNQPKSCLSGCIVQTAGNVEPLKRVRFSNAGGYLYKKPWRFQQHWSMTFPLMQASFIFLIGLIFGTLTQASQGLERTALLLPG